MRNFLLICSQFVPEHEGWQGDGRGKGLREWQGGHGAQARAALQLRLPLAGLAACTACIGAAGAVGEHPPFADDLARLGTADL
jgi:hypothetical protein